MNSARIDQIANSVLYEGYLLYPYRPSVKNRQRWTFGGVYPRGYSESQFGSDPWITQTECLVEGGSYTALEVKVRFLHLIDRQVGQRTLDNSQIRLVERLHVGDRLLIPWQEAMEREQSLAETRLGVLDRQMSVVFPASETLESIGDRAVFVRKQKEIAIAIDAFAERLDESLFKIRVRIENRTPWHEGDRDAALMQSLISAHTRLGVREGAFVSLFDPPPHWRSQAESCQNIGAWPILVGNPGERDAMLSAPIILHDYPEIAAESPGDLFDSTEIDEILTLRIMTMTPEERQLAVAVDERARALLHRTDNLAEAQMRGLHGTMRGLRPVPQEASHDG